MPRTHALLPALLLGSLSLVACGDSTGTSSTSQAPVTMSMASRPRSAATPSRASYAVTSSTPGTYTDGTNTLVLTKVQVVLRKIELQQSSATCAKASASVDLNAGAAMNDETEQGHVETEAEANAKADGCAELKIGPVLLDVPVTTAGAQQTLTINLPVGTYDQFEFQIHKPSGSSDTAFLTDHPDFAGTSIHVEGTWNGVAFAYNTGLTAVEELQLAQPLVVADNTPANVTVLVDVSQWFASGGSLLDPSSGNAGQPNEAVIAQNIRASFHAFEDEDHDGEDDHGHHD